MESDLNKSFDKIEKHDIKVSTVLIPEDCADKVIGDLKKAFPSATKYLHMHIGDCLECPMKRFNAKEGYFYCSHIECLVNCPEDSILVKSDRMLDSGYYIQDFELLEGFMPIWCPLPDESMDR